VWNKSEIGDFSFIKLHQTEMMGGGGGGVVWRREAAG